MPPVSGQSVKVLIAEDDAVQRAALVELLSTLKPHWHVVAAASTVAEVSEAIDSLVPDLCLIDIHLAGEEDAGWIKSLAPDLCVIYVTGDPDHAIHAFDSRAVDYILKPITPRRLNLALERAEQDHRLARKLSEASSGAYMSRIMVSCGNDALVVLRDDIVFLEADTKYTLVATQRAAGLVKLGINELSTRLPRDQFVRIHRRHVVNLHFVDRVRRSELGHLEVHLRGRSEVLRVSKPYEHLFRRD